MLILTRRTSETLYIGDGPERVQVTVLGVKGANVRIGLTAPKSIPIHREEIYKRIHEELEAAGPQHPQPADEPNGNVLVDET